jgi:hypothetical protein
MQNSICIRPVTRLDAYGRIRYFLMRFMEKSTSTLVASQGNKAGVITEFPRMPYFTKEVRHMAGDDTMVYPTGLTEAQALEINEGLKWGTRIYFAIAVSAHVLAFVLTPWLK